MEILLHFIEVLTSKRRLYMNRLTQLPLVVLVLGLTCPLKADDVIQSTGSVQGGESTQPSRHYSLSDADRQHVKPVRDPVDTERRVQRKLLETTVKKLKLSPDQQTAVQEAFQEQDTRMDTALREFMEKVKTIEGEKDQKILATLSDDQKKKYQEIEEEVQKEAEESEPDESSGQHGQGGGHHGRHGGMGGGAGGM